MKNEKIYEMPSAEQVEAELKRVKYQNRYRSILRSTIYMLIVVAAVAILVATLWLPVLQIYGNSMTPTIQDGEIIFSIKTSKFNPGDIAAFYYNNKILVKRVICGAGDWIDIDEDGTVYVNEVPLEEPYLTKKHWESAILRCLIKFLMGGGLLWVITVPRRWTPVPHPSDV